MVKKTPNVKV